VADEINPLTCAVQYRSIAQNLDNVLTLLQALIISMCTTAHISEVMFWRPGYYAPDENNRMDNATNEEPNQPMIDYTMIFEKSWILFTTLTQEYMRNPGTVAKKHAAVA
jgi:hypothetical protein